MVLLLLLSDGEIRHHNHAGVLLMKPVTGPSYDTQSDKGNPVRNGDTIAPYRCGNINMTSLGTPVCFYRPPVVDKLKNSEKALG